MFNNFSYSLPVYENSDTPIQFAHSFLAPLLFYKRVTGACSHSSEILSLYVVLNNVVSYSTMLSPLSFNIFINPSSPEALTFFINFRTRFTSLTVMFSSSGRST